MPTSYTHVGRRLATGHYAVTADAHRTPGKIHALNLHAGTAYKALCGVVVRETSDDHFVPSPQVIEATPGHRITCKRCRTVMDA